MTSQTVKYAKVRAAADPDREDGAEGRDGIGVYSGANIPHRTTWPLSTPEFVSVMSRQRTTHGACH